MRWNKLLILSAAMVLSGCLEKSGDTLILADGRVMEGDLISIGSGSILMSDTTISVSGEGRIWGLNGRTASGAIGYENGRFSAGAAEFPEDSVRVVLWNHTGTETETIQVHASSGWHSTSIEAAPGDIVAIRSNGTVVTEVGSTNPDGHERYSSSNALVPGAKSGQLVLRAGGGAAMAAGRIWSAELTEGGTLELAVNVPLEGSIEPSGVYTVHLTTGSGGRQPGTTAFYPASK